MKTLIGLLLLAAVVILVALIWHGFATMDNDLDGY